MAKQLTVSDVDGIWVDPFNIGSETPCFYCGEKVGEVCVFWMGVPDCLILHSRCAVKLAHKLSQDSESEARPVNMPRQRETV